MRLGAGHARATHFTATVPNRPSGLRGVHQRPGVGPAGSGRDPRGQERTEPAHHSMRLRAHRPPAANDLLPTVFPPMSQTAGLSRLRSQRTGSGIRKVMVMRVFVAGGTGVVGRRLVPQLVARGHQVTATTTSAAKLGLLAQLGADGVVMDGLDAMSVGAAVAAARPDAI